MIGFVSVTHSSFSGTALLLGRIADGGPVTAWNGAKGDIDPIGAVYRNNGKGELDQLLLVEL